MIMAFPVVVATKPLTLNPVYVCKEQLSLGLAVEGFGLWVFGRL